MDSWNKWYLQAQKYYKKNGNLEVPADYVDEEGFKLGQWISTQRRYYRGNSKRGTITKENIEKLEQIGMVWKPLEIQWKKNYASAKLFSEQNGHLYVPQNYITDSGINLGSWIRNQRSKYQKGELTKEQIKKLESIGMIWNLNDNEWMKFYLLAKEYYDKNMNLYIPLRYCTESGEKLGTWIGRQRRRKNGKRGNLTSKQEELLNSIGMVWNPKEVFFEECFSEAMEYYLNVGDLEIESTYVSCSGKKLGQWISNLRSAYKRNCLSDDKVKRLESIGMVWEVKNSASQTSYPEQIILFYLKREFSDVINRYKELGFELDIYIPSIKVGIEYDGAAWHKNKKVADDNKNLLCKENNIEIIRFREENCPQLNGISLDINVGKYTIENVINACNKLFLIFVKKGYLQSMPILNYNEDISEIRKQYRNAKNESWELMYKEAEQFYFKNGNLNIPVNYVTDNGYQLGTWITNQRNNYFGHSGVGIDSSRVKKLERIGMIWRVSDLQWDIGYQEAKKYYNEFGNINVNVDYVTKTGYRLGIWIRSQRKKDTLSKKQRKMLDDLGMIWSIFDDNWTKGVNEAERYFIIHGDLRVPAGFITDSKFSLGNWIATQRSRFFAKNGEKRLSEEQIKKLEQIGMIWDMEEDIWQQGFVHAQDYYHRFGDLLVPFNYVCDDGYKLGNWIQARRGGYKGTGTWAKPTKYQIKLLEDIGMIWDVEEYMWNKNYLIAKEYYKKNGNLLVPKRYETTNGEKLGLWIQRQRRMYAGKEKKKLSKNRIKMLEDIGIIW